MRTIFLTESSSLSERAAEYAASYTQLYDSHKDIFFRRSFQSALTDASAIALIDLAESEGLHYLVDELKSEFYNCTGISVEEAKANHGDSGVSTFDFFNDKDFEYGN